MLFENKKKINKWKVLLDRRRPFMNRVGKFRFAHAEHTRVQQVAHPTVCPTKHYEQLCL